ncbi:MAG TPA: hypothetical protein VIO61_15520 [Anaerolineaceae bacterium]
MEDPRNFETIDQELEQIRLEFQNLPTLIDDLKRTQALLNSMEESYHTLLGKAQSIEDDQAELQKKCAAEWNDFMSQANAELCSLREETHRRLAHFDEESRNFLVRLQSDSDKLQADLEKNRLALTTMQANVDQTIANRWTQLVEQLRNGLQHDREKNLQMLDQHIAKSASQLAEFRQEIQHINPNIQAVYHKEKTLQIWTIANLAVSLVLVFIILGWIIFLP